MFCAMILFIFLSILLPVAFLLMKFICLGQNMYALKHKLISYSISLENPNSWKAKMFFEFY